jgi:ATP-binding cassette subfamily B protein
MNIAMAGYIERLPPPPGATVAAEPAEPADPTASFSSQLHAAGLVWRCAALLSAHMLERVFLLASWICIGAGALSGRLEYGWLMACALALASTVPLHAASTWLQGVVAIGFGGLLKQRLLIGAMAADADLVRSKGVGELMSEVFESEAIDNLGATGGLATTLALLDLLIAPLLLFWGSGGVIQIPILLGWSALLALLIVDNVRLRLRWTQQRVQLTNELVENMTAHRTRVVQQAPAEWHLAEDIALDEYLVASEKLDRSTARIETAVPRGYIVVAFAGLAPAFVAGSATLPQLTISLGMILFAASSFERFCLGYSRTAAAWAAWQILKPMFDAAGRCAPAGVVGDVASMTSTVLHAREVGFAYPGRLERVLGGCSVSIEHGDQILLEGASGSGKSTFAAVLAGSRTPSDGFVLTGGLDRHTLGDAAWRRRIALAPQYHENYIFAAPLSFNLLLARPYPHAQADIDEATEVCRELGLGPLLDRMPAGINEFIGDTGWHLSQGERSRIFLARALLQRADVVVLDESLAALDPENLRQCLGCVMRRAPTAIVIAHP